MKIALIDFSNIFRVRWHASENEMTSDTVRRVVSQITGYASGYDRVAICTDSPPYKRTEKYSAYKEQREAAPAVMYETMLLALDELRGDGFPILGVEGYEADDIIASVVTTLATGRAYETCDLAIDIYSADKDLAQLVRKREGPYLLAVRVVSTMVRDKETGEPAVYDVGGVTEKFGVPPKLIGDFLALLGDKSDNIPGAKGVGKVTAAKWLNEHGCLDGVLEASGQGKLNKAGNEMDGAMLKMARDLIELDTGAPVDTEWVRKERKPKEMEMPDPKIEAEDKKPAPKAALVKAEAAVVATPAPDWERGLEPQTMAAAKWLAKDLFDSRLFGDFPNPQSILAIVMTGRTLGLDSVSSLRAFYIVKGKPCLAAASMVGLVRKRADVCEYFDIMESTSEICTIETKRVGSKNPTKMSFTISDAKRAGLDGSQTYKKYPATMLRHRCESEVCRAVYSDIILGLYTVEEMEAA